MDSGVRDVSISAVDHRSPVTAGTPHPAVYSAEILSAIETTLNHYYSGPVVLDPFAGTGAIHSLRRFATIGVELEPEWAEMSSRTIVGDAASLPFANSVIDSIVTSPCNGNRMADHHNAKDGSYRRTYRHYLGRPLSPNSAGGMQWGHDYRELHIQAWGEAARVIRPGGLILLNIKDHRRAGKRIHASAWHAEIIRSLGFRLVSVRSVSTPEFRFGANLDNLFPERLLVFASLGTAWHWHPSGLFQEPRQRVAKRKFG
jgi:SAM-dependent methyltransferase